MFAVIGKLRSGFDVIVARSNESIMQTRVKK